MPRFFFDFDDGDHQTTDREGHEHVDADAAQRDARRALLGLAGEWRAVEGRRSLSCRVRGEADCSVYVIALAMHESSTVDAHAAWGSSIRSDSGLNH